MAQLFATSRLVKVLMALLLLLVLSWLERVRVLLLLLLLMLDGVRMLERMWVLVLKRVLVVMLLMLLLEQLLVSKHPGKRELLQVEGGVEGAE